MCFNDLRSNSAAQPPPAPPLAARRTRSKTRRPRFLSLGRQILFLGSPTPMSSANTDDCRQLDLLPLHPPDKDPQVASLLHPDVDPEVDQPSLAAILGSSNPSSTSSSCCSSTAQAPPSTPSSGISWENHEDGEDLARRALRGRERWVFCKYSAEDAAGSSCAAGIDIWSAASCRALSLKLDYEEILSAWSDRGSLYIDGEGSGMALPHEIDVDEESGSPEVFIEVGSGGKGGGWSKAEDCGGREERVRRYKEKRRSRLFAKRIRYEVRKLNAEKRPRVKGRFVKRRDDP